MNIIMHKNQAKLSKQYYESYEKKRKKKKEFA